MPFFFSFTVRLTLCAGACEQAFNVLQPKSTVLKSNNENITLKVFNPKLDTKFNVEPYKPFSVVEQENRIFDQVSDENKPPVTNDDEVDHVVIANISIPGIRYAIFCLLFFPLSLLSQQQQNNDPNRTDFEYENNKNYIKTLPFLFALFNFL